MSGGTTISISHCGRTCYINTHTHACRCRHCNSGHSNGSRSDNLTNIDHTSNRIDTSIVFQPPLHHRLESRDKEFYMSQDSLEYKIILGPVIASDCFRWKSIHCNLSYCGISYTMILSVLRHRYETCVDTNEVSQSSIAESNRGTTLIVYRIFFLALSITNTHSDDQCQERDEQGLPQGFVAIEFETLHSREEIPDSCVVSIASTTHRTHLLIFRITARFDGF